MAQGSYIDAGRTADMLKLLGDELRSSDIVAILQTFRLNDQRATPFSRTGCYGDWLSAELRT